MRKLRKNRLQTGQALLIIVLVMVVSLTVGLSIATRSITNSRISTEEENSQRAFSAAEAGIEQLLRKGSTEPFIQETPIGNNTTYSARVISPNTSQILLNGGSLVKKDEGVDFWLSDYNPTYTNKYSGTFTVYWGEGGPNDSCSVNPPTAAAIEVVVLSGADINNPVAAHYVADPCPLSAGGRHDTNNFGNAQGGGAPIAGVQFTHRMTVPSSGSITNGIVARIIPLYNSTKIAVTGSNLRPQGKEVESTGSSGGTARKVTVYRSYPKLPIEIFPYVIFSP